MIRSILFVLMLGLSSGLIAQNYNIVSFKGKAFLEDEKGEEVKITLYQKNKKVSSYTTAKNGKFILDLERDHYYVVEFSKKNYVSKRLVIKTQMPSAEEYPRKKFNFDVNLIGKEEGVDYSPLDFPIAIIEYHDLQGMFFYDTEYSEARIKEEEQLVNSDPYLALN